MKLHALTCAVFPSPEVAHERMWIFFASVQKFRIDMRMYGNGRGFPGYRAMCHDFQLEYLKTLPSDTTHVLYTEGWDVFFLQSMDEITRKYEAMGSPQMLIAAFHQLANVSTGAYAGCFDTQTRYCYPQVGGYIAELPYLIEMMERMLKLPNANTGDNCFLHYDAWKEGWYRPTLDSTCQIFQVGEEDCDVISDQGSPVLWNTHTGSRPAILHLSGGYTDPITGKDYRLKPWAERLGIV